MTWGSTSDEDKLLLSRAYDAIELSERRRSPAFFGFLNEHERMYLSDHLPDAADIRFFGGYEGALRVMLGACSKEEDFPISAIRVSFPAQYTLSHRDVLGSLMALGLTRESIGDILTGEGTAVIFARDEIAPFIFSQLSKIGRVGVKLSAADTDDLPKGDRFDERVLTLSSPRLDAFVSAVTGLSREKSAKLIRSDMVAVDHVTENSISKSLCEGNTITVRKYGKYVFAEDLGLSKKGKHRISVKHFR